VRRSTPKCTATIRIEETAGRTIDRAAHNVRIRLRTDPDKTAVPAWSPAEQRRLSTTLAATGHVARLTILRLLLTGPATYQAVRHATKLKPGPLYHHINQLRLAGLILPKQRDLYELTRAGRNLLLLAMAMPKLVADRRRRPT
jgi:DNA-binding HxlR family transcriptional regulator